MHSMEECERGEVEQEKASDSDSAPDDVSLSRGREEALKTRRATSTEARRATERMKERRKKRQQLYKTQKDAKEERKRSTRFPEADLKKLREMEQQIAQEDNSEEPASKSSRKIRRKNQRKSKKQPQTERQFGSVRVEALQTNPDRTLPAAVGRERALEFLQQQLYQSNRYRRIPAISFHSQKCRNKPAAIFV